MFSWRKAVLKGYQPVAHPATAHCIYLDFDGHEVQRPCSPSNTELLVLFPTVADRCSRREYLLRAEAFFRAIRSCSESCATTALVAIQCSSADWEECRARASITLELARNAGIILNLRLSTDRGKTVSINAALAHCRASAIPMVGWIDDDVVVSDTSFAALVATLRLQKEGSVGASKIPQPRRLASSRALHWAKERMRTPATQYPHGCCLVAYVDSIGDAIPGRYVCEDGYLCFKLLRPQHPQPMGRMSVVPTATCHHLVGGTWPEMYFRIRRSLLSVLIFVCDFPSDVGAFYLRSIQFSGFWPIGAFETSMFSPRGVLKWLLKGVLFVWFVAVALELVVRGLVSRPLKTINWAAYSWEAPEVDS